MTQSDWVCLPNPVVGWGEEGSKVWKLGILLRHVFFVFHCWRVCRHQHVLVREFSTVPLLLVFSLLWPLRKKLVFLIHHNVQWAVRNRMERFGLMMLSRMGARWAVFETQDFSDLGKFNIPSDQNLVLPHPCDAMRQKSGRASLSERAVIGVAGYYRPEKGMDELIRLLQENFPNLGILLGVPNPEAVRHLGVEVVDTSTDDAYREMISRCDVLVQNGAEESYFYRASGPIADAAACGTAVVVPDFPIIGKQVAGIGEVFQGLEKMPKVVRRAIEKMRNGEYDFETYCAARSAQAIAKKLDGFNIEKRKETKKELATNKM